MTSRPRAFRLPPADGRDPASVRLPAGVAVTEEPLEAVAAADGVAVVTTRRRRAPWLGLLLSALGGLASLGIGLAVERLIGDLFAAAAWLGWVGLGLLAVAGLSLAGLVLRELRGFWRERRVERLRQAAAEALAIRDGEAAKRVARDLAATHADGPEIVAELRALEAEIMDADDRLAVAERLLVARRDVAAKREIAGAAKRVSVVTALSPRAIVDVAFVVFAAAQLLRRIARIYGGRPGVLGGLRLARAALNHLAVTGGVAVGDSLVQQVLGFGLAAKLSAKLGEGVLNGLMTARFGLSALEVCRPLPFIRETPPRLADVAGELLTTGAPEDRRPSG